MMQSNYYHHYCLSQLLKKGLLVIFISLPILGISATTTIDENNFNVLEQQQSRKLIGELLTLDNPYHCPHGRPTIIAMTKRDLEKKFKRIV